MKFELRRDTRSLDSKSANASLFLDLYQRIISEPKILETPNTRGALFAV